MENEVKYHIFRVYDYKGGELSHSINLTKKQFIEEIVEYYDDGNISTDLNNITLSKLKEELSEYNLNRSIYAGGDGFVMEMFKSVNNELLPVDFSDFLSEIAEYMLKYWIDYDKIAKTEVWYSIKDGGDGSAYPRWFLTEKDAEYDQLYDAKMGYGGWGEICIGSVETFIRSDIHLEAINNSDYISTLRKEESSGTN